MTARRRFPIQPVMIDLDVVLHNAFAASVAAAWPDLERILSQRVAWDHPLRRFLSREDRDAAIGRVTAYLCRVEAGMGPSTLCRVLAMQPRTLRKYLAQFGDWRDDVPALDEWLNARVIEVQTPKLIGRPS